MIFNERTSQNLRRSLHLSSRESNGIVPHLGLKGSDSVNPDEGRRMEWMQYYERHWQQENNERRGRAGSF